MRGRLIGAAALASLLLGALCGDASAQSREERRRPPPPPIVRMQPIPNDVRVPEPVARPRPSRSAAAARPRAAGGAAAPAAAAEAPPTPVLDPPPPTGPSPREAPLAPAALEAFVDGVVLEAMDVDHIAGVTVSVVQDGQILLAKGYGVADLSPVRPVDPNRTLFRVASISKTFTWLLMAQQMEAGRYTLETPINDLLPPELRVPDQGFREPIRVRHLMTHSAGFEDKALGHLFEDKPEAIRPRTQYLIEERPRRVRAPGVQPVYSNYGVGLAGAIVERVGGRPYEVLLEERLLRPLGMNRTTVREPYPPRAGLPTPMDAGLAMDVSKGFAASAGAYKPVGFEYVTQLGPVGGVSTTAGDISRYMLALLNGGGLEGATVFGPATARRLRTALLRPNPGMNGWTLGFNEYRLPGGLRGYGHGGDTSFFHSNLVLVPDLRLGVFVSTNTGGGGRLAGTLSERIVGRFYGGAPAGLRPGSPELTANASAYTGSWLGTRRAYSGLEKLIGAIAFSVETSVTPEGRLLVAGQRPSQWSPSGEPGRFVRADGADVIAFDLENGRPVRWYAPWGGMAFERAPFHRTPNGLLLFAGLAVVAALLAVVGPFLRIGRDVRGTAVQTTSNAVLIGAGLLWLVSLAVFGMWAQRATADMSAALYDWPGAVAIASWMWLTAGVLTFGLLVLLVGVWRRSDRRGWGWSVWRKARHTLAVLVFAAFAVVLMLNGGLEPWSG